MWIIIELLVTYLFWRSALGGIAVITNPYAKTNKRLPGRYEDFKSIIGDSGTVYQTENMSHLYKVCRELAENPPSLLCICGGDGTMHKVCTALIHACMKASRPVPKLMFLVGGSMNTIRVNMGYKKQKADDELTQVVSKHRGGKEFRTRRQNLLGVNDHFGFIFGNGFAVNFLEEYYGENGIGGPKRAMSITLQAISSILGKGQMYQRLKRQYRADVLIDGKPAGLDSYSVVLAGTMENVGIQFRPLYRANEHPDKFHALISSNTPGDFITQVHRVYKGGKLKGEHHIDTLAKELVIKADKPLGYQLDGELYKDTEVKVTMGYVIDLYVP